MANLQAKNRLVKPFIPNSKIMFTLPLGGKIRRGMIALVGNVNATAGTTSGTMMGEGGPANLIQRVIVTATPAGGSRYPGGKIVDSDVRSLLRYAVTQRSGKFIGDLLGSTLSAGAVANSSVYTAVPIYFADASQKNTLLTALNTDQLTSDGTPTYATVQVEVDTGSLASCFTGNDRTPDYSGLTLQWADERVTVPGDTAVLYQESHVVQIPANNKRMLDEAMPQDGAFLSWQILGELSAQKTLSDALLNRVVCAGQTLDFDKYAMDIRESDLADEWYDPSTTATGMYFIDFTDGAVRANTVPAAGLQTYFDVNNVSGANLDDLNFFTRRLVPALPAKSTK